MHWHEKSRRRLESITQVEDFGCAKIVCQKFGLNISGYFLLTHYNGKPEEKNLPDKTAISPLQDGSLLVVEIKEYLHKKLGSKDQIVYLASQINEQGIMKTLRIIRDLAEKTKIELSVPEESHDNRRYWEELPAKASLPPQHLTEKYKQQYLYSFEKITAEILLQAKEQIPNLPEWVLNRTGPNFRNQAELSR
jgi:hypothetical protein